MSKSGSFTAKRTVCAAATVALAATGLLAGVAQAADSELSYGNIQTDKQGTVTIHKLETGSLANGPASEGHDNATGDGVQNVTFKLYKINVDLTTPEGWRKIAAVGDATPAEACGDNAEANWAAFGTQNPLTAAADGNKGGVTATGGKVTVAEVPVGAYLVCEQPTIGAQNSANEAVSVVKRSAPFIVTVPRPHTNGDADNKGWIYDVHAYPKNTVLPYPKKVATIKNNAATVNDGVEYTISSKIPNLLTDQNYKFFSVIDQMPTEITNASVASVKIQTGEDVDGAVVVDTDKYVVDYQEGLHFLAVNFNKAGLEHLKANANKKVVVTIKAKVNAVSATNIENTGYVAMDVVDGPAPSEDPTTPVNPGGPGKDPTPKTGTTTINPSNKSASLWGDLKISKYDAANKAGGPLKDAIFQVFDVADDKQAECAAAAATDTHIYANAVVTEPLGFGADGSQKDFATTAEGTVVIPGLFINKGEAVSPNRGNDQDANEKVDFTGKDTRCYIVREKEAPAGYVLPEEAQRTYAVIVKAGTSQDADIEIANTKVSVPALPLTGASGRVLLMTGGAALVMGSMGFVMVSRRRKSEN